MNKMSMLLVLKYIPQAAGLRAQGSGPDL